MELPDEPPCGFSWTWWEGEYEGECELPENHGGDHFDGLSWCDVNREMVDHLHTEQEGKLMDESIQPNEVTAALNALRGKFDVMGSVKVSDFIWDGQTPKERAEGIKKLQAADEREDLAVRFVVGSALRAARDART